MIDALSLDQFAVFATVVDEGSFAAAARRLNRAQSAITYAIQKLEDQTGVPLFDRSTYRPALTEEGKNLLPRIRRILADVEDYRLHARQMAMGVEDELRLAVHPYTPANFLSDVLRDFRVTFPSVRIVASLQPRMAAIDSLQQGKSDLALVFALVSLGEAFKHLSCTAVELVAVASPEHPLARKDGPIGPELLRDDLQIAVHDGLTSEEERLLHGYGMDSTEIWRVINFEIMHSLLLGAVGWGVVPLSRVAEDLAVGRLVALQIERWKPLKGALTIPLVVVQASDRPLGPAGRWLFQKFAEAGGLGPHPSRSTEKASIGHQQNATNEYQNERTSALGDQKRRPHKIDEG
jgi:DNA-binding transcriptional LysR family regulator